MKRSLLCAMVVVSFVAFSNVVAAEGDIVAYDIKKNSSGEDVVVVYAMDGTNPSSTTAYEMVIDGSAKMDYIISALQKNLPVTLSQPVDTRVHVILDGTNAVGVKVY